MQDLVTPESLDELDRRVYDLAVQPMPLAEIAVRLGVPVAQADERLQRVFRRLGVSGRAGLRALAAGTPAIREEPEFVIGAEPEYVIGREARAAQVRSGIGRRRFLAGAAAVGATAAVSGGAAAVLTRRGRAPAGDADVEPSPTASAIPALPIQAGAGAGVAFTSLTWALGAPIDRDSGMFLMQPDSGTVTGYWFHPPLPNEPYLAKRSYSNYRTGFASRFIAATGSDDREYLLERTSTDRTWSWPATELRLVAFGGALPNDFLLVEEMFGHSGLGKFHVLTRPPGERDLNVRTSFELPVKDSYSTAIGRPGGQELLLWTGDRSSPLLYQVNAGTGATRLLLGHPGDAPAGLGNSWSVMPFEVFDDWVRTTWLVRGPDGAAVYLSRSFDWDGNVVHDIFKGGFDLSFSPDGKRFVREQVERMAVVPDTDGEREFWTNVESGEWSKPPEFRIRSASVHYGDALPPRRWLADGSGFVALVRGPSQANGQLTYQGVIYSSDGSKSTRIPVPQAALEPKRWFERSWDLGPVPSPYDRNLIAFGRTMVYDVARNRFLAPNIASDSGPDHIDPWCAGPGLFVFALPHGGHGGASSPLLLPPKVEKPPKDDGMRFVVQGTGDGLNLRNGPSKSERVLVTVADGTELRIAEDNSKPVGRRSSTVTDAGAWVYVEAPGKIFGWVFAEYLGWA